MTCIIIGLVSSIALAWLGAISLSRNGIVATAQKFPSGEYVQQTVGVTVLPMMPNAERVTGEKLWSDLANWPPSDIRGQTALESRLARKYSVVGNPGGRVGKLEAGWPLRCLESRFRSPEIVPVTYEHALEVAGRQLPYRPRYGALALNTLLLAMVAYLLSLMGLTTRRTIRRRRGRCPSCAYDLRGSPDACPECGERAAREGDRAEVGKG